MQEILDWLPYIGTAAIPGLFNIFVAFEELNKQCQFLPFFEPRKSSGFWLWAVIQFLLPSVLFWFTASLSSQAAINPRLLAEAIGFGLGFLALLNARTEIGDFPPVDIKAIYALCVRFAFWQISSSQTRRAADFWTDFERELNQESDKINKGLNYLKNYFTFDLSLTQQEEQAYKEELDRARTNTQPEEQAKAIRSLMAGVRRQDLPKVLPRFNCSDDFLKKYFPKDFP